MVDLLPRTDASLPDLLAHRARHVSRSRLMLDLTAGAFLLVVSLAYRSEGWLLVASVGGCFLTFGAWGMLDRALARHDPRRRGVRRLLRGAEIVVAALGAVSGVTLFLVVFGYALGTSWQS